MKASVRTVGSSVKVQKRYHLNENKNLIAWSKLYRLIPTSNRAHKAFGHVYGIVFYSAIMLRTKALFSILLLCLWTCVKLCLHSVIMLMDMWKALFFVMLLLFLIMCTASFSAVWLCIWICVQLCFPFCYAFGHVYSFALLSIVRVCIWTCVQLCFPFSNYACNASC
jgi:hypothetical protein